MSAWALYVALYLLVGFGLTEIGKSGMQKRGDPMKWYTYLIGVFLWPLILLVFIRLKSNK